MAAVCGRQTGLCLAAGSAGPHLLSRSGAGGRFALRPVAPCMAQGLGEAVPVALAAGLAGALGISALGAGGWHHSLLIRMLRHCEGHFFRLIQVQVVILELGDGERRLRLLLCPEGQGSQHCPGGDRLRIGVAKGHPARLFVEAAVSRLAICAFQTQAVWVIVQGNQPVGGSIVGCHGQGHSLAGTLRLMPHTLEGNRQSIQILPGSRAGMGHMERAARRYALYGSIRNLHHRTGLRLHRKHGRLRHIDGAFCGRPVLLHRIQGGGPHAAAHVGDQRGNKHALLCIPAQAVNLCAVPCEPGKIQVPVISRHHGAVLQLLIHGEVHAQVCGHKAKAI